MIKVLLVHGQRLFNEALLYLLIPESDIIVIGNATTAKAVMEQMKVNIPHVILLDTHAPNFDSLQLTMHIKNQYPDVKIILLADSSNCKIVVSGMDAGADGYLLKTVETEILTKSIRSAYRNQEFTSGEAVKILAKPVNEVNYYGLHEIVKRELEKRDISLSHIELEIALLLVNRYTDTEIAQKLYINQDTLKQYIDNIFQMLNVHTRKEARNYLEELST